MNTSVFDVSDFSYVPDKEWLAQLHKGDYTNILVILPGKSAEIIGSTLSLDSNLDTNAMMIGSSVYTDGYCPTFMTDADGNITESVERFILSPEQVEPARQFINQYKLHILVGLV